MKRILVCGAGGFIGTHLVRSLKAMGHYVIGADLKYPEFSVLEADEFYQVDLRDPRLVSELMDTPIDEVYQLAADMGGAGFIFTGINDADIMHNSATINLNVLNEMSQRKIPRVFYSSSACIYPSHNQLSTTNPVLTEESAYPAYPDSEYGWEKLFSERLYVTYARNCNIDVRIARLHNVFGTEGTWQGGREKAPAALCRKVAECGIGGTVEIWGPGTQTRSFLYIDDCIDGIHRLMENDFQGPLNLGSDRMISINELAHLIAKIAGKNINIKNVDGPIGVNGRTSDNSLILDILKWAPPDNLEKGLGILYKWIEQELHGKA